MGSITKHEKGNGENDLLETHLKWKESKRENKQFIYVFLHLSKKKQRRNWAIIFGAKNEGGWEDGVLSPPSTKDVSLSKSLALAECGILILCHSPFSKIPHLNCLKAPSLLCLLGLLSYSSSFVTGIQYLPLFNRSFHMYSPCHCLEHLT